MSDERRDGDQRVGAPLPVDPSRRTEIDKQRVPMAARPYRLLALVKQDAVVRVQKEPDDTVMTWPHLLTIEFLAAVAMSIFLLLLGLFINAPLEELANPNVTVAGALTPIGVLVGSALIPYLDRRNVHSTRPSDRKLEVTLFSILWALGLAVTFIGIFFRGPGYSFILPWSNGFFFSL